MASPRLLIDNDILFLLGGCGLLEEAAGVLGFALDACLRRDSVPFMARKSKKIRAQYPAEALSAVQDLCVRIPVVDYAADPALSQRLAEAPHVDEGETQLIAILIEQPTWLLTTGDKQALQSLASIEVLADLRAAVAGRIVCLETILLTLMQRSAPLLVAERLRVVRDAHKTLRTVFIDSNIVTPGACEEGLLLYNQQLAAEVGPDFLYVPEG